MNTTDIKSLPNAVDLIRFALTIKRKVELGKYSGAMAGSADKCMTNGQVYFLFATGKHMAMYVTRNGDFLMFEVALC